MYIVSGFPFHCVYNCCNFRVAGVIVCLQAVMESFISFFVGDCVLKDKLKQMIVRNMGKHFTIFWESST